MIIGIFALCWAVSALLYRARGYDKIVVVSRVRD
jgi:hypothetical protein